MKDIKYLIIPDVHGRDFWKNPVDECLKDENIKIIFEGDYHDPYFFEYPEKYEEEILQHSIDNFKKILDFKKTSPDRITLLLGNHDCGYAIGSFICSSRRDTRHAQELENLFKENRECFQLAEECTIGDTHFIFSHAGILKGWAESCFGQDMVSRKSFNIVDNLNNAWLMKDEHILFSLDAYDSYRGFGGYKYGSPIWSDIRSWAGISPDETFGFNIVGHTQTEEHPILLDTIVDLDCRKVFYLDGEGNLKEFDSGETIFPQKMR